MNISEAAKKVQLTPVALRYYEKIGLIPPIKRKNGGVREYQEKDLHWIEHIKCMRESGLCIESLIEYTHLYQQGPETKKEREQLLRSEREGLLTRYNELGETIERLNKKIDHYSNDNERCTRDIAI
ncbi:MerR family transcriptional regulator [Candidatus Enterococcus ferrettii]|uniref:HTH merR-type domain-containing protein n=1 Tax=Candidatus Enterococcus ferrettii TaxID=2815324 RepID=A0ABV0EP23_9ENTE|nr:MerR family transcriptional regulator [Enterococcus sp. 665A]MBO1342910.1 MerR family transcriptional regulator [Enterococcus sp. 665A]